MIIHRPSCSDPSTVTDLLSLLCADIEDAIIQNNAGEEDYSHKDVMNWAIALLGMMPKHEWTYSLERGAGPCRCYRCRPTQATPTDAGDTDRRGPDEEAPLTRFK